MKNFQKDCSTVILSEFISGLPAGWATAPIYRAGVELPNGKPACGKSPMGRAHQDNLAPKASLHYLNQAPEKYGAMGCVQRTTQQWSGDSGY